MHGLNGSYAYSLWSLVLFNSGLFAFFLVSFIAPLGKREWRSMGVVLAFIVALFTEMYGFPLTIYALSGLLGSRYQVLNPFSHANGHLWVVLFGGGDMMMTAIHLVSNGLVVVGFLVMGKGWNLVHRAGGGLVSDGLYAHVRHPQYSGLFLVVIGMLIQWPTLITAVMFPVLVFMYYRLSKKEEREMLTRLGDEYREYMGRTSMFMPRFTTRSAPHPSTTRVS
jgi:protein-S-isoprenylcysteine O-methyltransferase Ste14